MDSVRPASDPVLSLEGVWLTHRRGPRHIVKVLTDVSLTLRAGESVAVMAQPAQGKTSLLRVAAGVERPDRGSVLFEGEDLWRLSDRRRSHLLRGQIGLIDRGAPQLDVPVLTGIALPLMAAHGRRGAYERARQALAYVEAPECADQRWNELADYERALVALARGVAREPVLLLVDDPAATLGIVETEQVSALLGRLARERRIAVLICAGSTAVTSRTDRIASLAGGLLSSPPPLEGGPMEAEVIDFPGGRQRQASP